MQCGSLPHMALILWSSFYHIKIPLWVRSLFGHIKSLSLRIWNVALIIPKELNHNPRTLTTFFLKFINVIRECQTHFHKCVHRMNFPKYSQMISHFHESDGVSILLDKVLWCESHGVSNLLDEVWRKNLIQIGLFFKMCWKCLEK
jgi:hypothetical protein